MPKYEFDTWQFNAEDGRLSRRDGDAAAVLRPQVAHLLERLLQAPRTVVDREALQRAVWREGTVVDFEAGLAGVVRELRQALEQLGGDPSVVETVPRRGYRLNADVRRAEAERANPPLGPRRSRRQATLLLAGLMILLAALPWWFRSAPPPDLALPEPAEWTLAVLPFERYGQPPDTEVRLELLLADTLLAELWQADLGEIVLIGRATLLPYAGRDDVAFAVARDLGVRLLIEGSLVYDGADWVVTARLLDMPDGRVLWSESISWTGVEALPVRATARRFAAGLSQAWLAREPAMEITPTP